MSELTKEVRLSTVSTVHTYEMALGIKKYAIQFINLTVVAGDSHSGCTVIDLEDSRVLEGQELSDIITIFDAIRGETVN